MSNYTETARKNAEDFIVNETQFHLGFLPTEQSNPKTRNMDKVFKQNITDGVKMLQSVDRDIVPMARRIFTSDLFKKMTAVLSDAIQNGNKIVFSGCGATGRLSIMLESCWRKFWNDQDPTGNRSNQVRSIMTGGDYALVKSVEFFEDYLEFGRQQVRETGIVAGDVLVAITEGGETSSVLGTVDQALINGCEVFLLFNNPADVLSQKIERSRNAIEDPRVTVLDLACGPMALAGSTRMQATTSELLVAGVALEQTCKAILSNDSEQVDPVDTFEKLLVQLESDACLDAMSQWITIEQQLYSKDGLVTYFADELMLDIFTDTTERSPTFMLPPFTPCDDEISPLAWAFVKNPMRDNSAAWQRVFGRSPNCLEWTTELYREMNVPEELAIKPPKISQQHLYKFMIGCEPDGRRCSKNNAAVFVGLASESNDMKLQQAFEQGSQKFDNNYKIIIGKDAVGDILFPINIPDSPIGLWDRLTSKLILNTVSTAVMVCMGRVRSNWMSCVQYSNKKLIDRSIRLISELADLSYDQACLEFFSAQEEFELLDQTELKNLSLVEYVLQKIDE